MLSRTSAPSAVEPLLPLDELVSDDGFSIKTTLSNESATASSRVARRYASPTEGHLPTSTKWVAVACSYNHADPAHVEAVLAHRAQVLFPRRDERATQPHGARLHRLLPFRPARIPPAGSPGPKRVEPLSANRTLYRSEGILLNMGEARSDGHAIETLQVDKRS